MMEMQDVSALNLFDLQLDRNIYSSLTVNPGFTTAKENWLFCVKICVFLKIVFQ